MKVHFRVLPLFTITILILASFVLQGQADRFTEFLVANHHAFLDRIFDVKEFRPLEFYLGRMQDELWGPLSIICSTVAFLMFVWRYLLSSSGLIFGLSCFVYFIFSRLEILFWPPYGDSASGPFMEAIWLFENNFDYAGLFLEKNFVYGGPKVYLFSLYPTFQAFLMKLIPSTKVFLLLNHLITFLLSAVLFTFFRKILLKVTDAKSALLVTLVLLCWPLFQSQAEQINMEIPLTCFAVVSMYYLSQKRLALAFIFAALSTLMKGVGIAAPAAVFAIALFIFIFDSKHRGQWKFLIWGLISLGFVYLNLQLAKIILNEQGSNLSLVGAFQGWAELSKLAVPYLLMLSVALFVAGFWFLKVRDVKESFWEYLNRHFIYLVMLAVACAWFGVFINSSGQMVRYRLLLLPFLYFCVFYSIDRFIKNKLIVQLSLFVTIGLVLMNSYGLYYREHSVSIHSVVERSLEYRNDLKLLKLMSEEVETKFSEMTVGAQFTIAQMLAFPELGFVHNQLDVMIYEFPSAYKRIKNFQGIRSENITKTIWVGYEVDIPPILRPHLPGYPLGSKDYLLKKMWYGDKSVALFMGGELIQKRWMMYRKSRSNS